MAKAFLLHNALNRNRFKDKIMQQFKVLQRLLRVGEDARRCRTTPRKPAQQKRRPKPPFRSQSALLIYGCP
ncbi:hypothetical protein ELI03_20825 [Rhizobium leguminosarum]|uniref:Uncharacterized protein n=1 Tax=Rhizobium leguminosarum TaxID=384 RepID=A0A4Q8Y3S3_RHILE|nr:hypothetical protein ELI40_21685 [Rhizobium leguminosarum]TAX11573.1 hypothetical protein ELI07_19685 [Rhizobium leguminosarum]TAX74039.1 hypothetical protein ELI03_20825 [Rhizobium leguminosarum]TAY14462.1 hypothetical protein ELH96_23145 [Rhizobium leguminosarum]TAZ16515.1 hypothetical protein ELH81_21705 [Rhizobium leguminosarum]